MGRAFLSIRARGAVRQIAVLRRWDLPVIPHRTNLSARLSGRHTARWLRTDRRAPCRSTLHHRCPPATVVQPTVRRRRLNCGQYLSGQPSTRARIRETGHPHRRDRGQPQNASTDLSRRALWLWVEHCWNSAAPGLSDRHQHLAVQRFNARRWSEFCLQGARAMLVGPRASAPRDTTDGRLHRAACNAWPDLV